MVLKQYYLGCLAHASYLVADERTGAAAVVDPQRDVDEYLADAEEMGCRIGHVFLTHLHADFLAGHLELRDRVGAGIFLGARAQAEYAFTPLADGQAVELGRVRLVTLETPGHSPESISILVYDLDADSDRPYAVLTGDTLFIGDVGRPDLRASLGWSAEELGSMLYDSIHDKLLPLPDETLVYPAHGAGSLCGKHLSTDTVSTMGIQRQYNYALQPMSREEFVAVVTADQPDSPAYFTYDAVLNAKERPTLDVALAEGLTPLSLDEVLDLVVRGAQILDARSSADYEGAHLAGSVNIGLDGSYATWSGTLLDHERPIVIVCGTGSGRGGDDAARADRLRQRRGLSRRRHAGRPEPARARRTDRAHHRSDARRAAHGAGSAVRSRRPRRGRGGGDRRRGKREHPALTAARPSRRAAARPADRRSLLERVPLRDGSEHPAPLGLRSRCRPRRRPQPPAGAAVRSISLSSVFQLRCVPATPSPRSNQSSVSFVRPAPFPRLR